MKLEKTDLKVLAFLARDVRKQYSIKEIADQLARPYAKVHNSINRLGKKKVVRQKAMGRAHYCRIDYKNNIDIICFVEAQRARSFLSKRKCIKILSANIRRELGMPDYSLVVFGSHASGSQKKGSDLDLVVISRDTRKSQRAMSTVSRTSAQSIHSIEFSYHDFIEMLGSKGMNVGKEILGNHIILHGCEQFYECVRLAK